MVIPTETVYGLAARARDARAVGAVFQIKGRPQDNPLIVHVTRAAHLDEVGAVLSPIASALTRRFWPGPLTLVVAGGSALPWVTAGLDSVAVRHPAHAFAAALIDRTGPLAVSDLAIATGMNDPAVSQALRLLRAAGVVAGEKEGRVVRYRVVDEAVRGLLKQVS